jgi:hypothetical protein
LPATHGLGGWRVWLFIAVVVDVLIGTFVFFMAYADIDDVASSITYVGPDEWKYSRRVADSKVFD